MRKAIKRIVLRMFPELTGGYHLDKYARILKISDPPTEGAVCDRFRPYWAADIEILTPEGNPAPNFPKYEAVPLPVPAGGQDAGFFLWPRPGTIVTVRWIEGRPDHPVIQHVYPMGLSMPDVPDNMGRWQQRPGVYQTIDPVGNWERTTDKDINDNATNIHETATGERSETVGANSTETVGGDSTINITGKDSKTVGGDSTETVATAKMINAAVFTVLSPTITLGAPGSGPSLLPLIYTALSDIKAALDILADHTHPTVGTCSQSAAVHVEADQLGATNSELGTLMPEP